MYQLDLPIEYRVIIGISAMVLLFTGFLISFITSQRKKLQYHKEVQRMHEAQRKLLLEQNSLLEQRVEERTIELNQQKDALQTSLTHLKATQAQLIQREKLASLGELTAGIAHEIQNPLNFVNNFSEVSVELTEELQESLQTGDIATASTLATDLKGNLQHITRNGQRASNIVRGMLEHSRPSTGEKQLTNLDRLANEYFKIAYQGLRQSGLLINQNDLTVQLITDFAADLPPLEIMPQEIGRVLLNLYNNAFYAVSEKQKTAPTDYQPTVWVSTRREPGWVVVCVRDNGTGIPDTIRDKIFQPFFTTKPTGRGTGLGLSLSYDIVTKGHGGTLEVENREGEGAQFVITLPA